MDTLTRRLNAAAARHGWRRRRRSRAVAAATFGYQFSGKAAHVAGTRRLFAARP